MGNFNLTGGHSAANPGKLLSQVKYPSTCFLIAHGPGVATTWSPVHFDYVFNGGLPWIYPPHGGKGTHFYFVDDHVEWVPWKGDVKSQWWEDHPDWPPDPTWCYWVKFYGP
jgi:hypothetical protein